MISFIQDLMAFDFLLYGMLGLILISLSCGIISPLVIARKQAFMGAAVSHSSLLGLSIAFSLFMPEQSSLIFLTTLLITLVLSFFLAHTSYRQNIPEDGLIGVYFTTTMGLGLIIYNQFSKSSGDIINFLFGNVLLISSEDLVYLLIIALIILPTILLKFKSWLYMTFDPEGALVSGQKVYLYHILFFILLSALIVSSIKIAGTVLINTMLLIPGLFGMKMGKNSKQVFTYSLLFSVIVSIMGLMISNKLDLPLGATVAVTQFTVLMAFVGYEKLRPE